MREKNTPEREVPDDWLIWNQTEFRLILNHSENGEYNPISVDLTDIK